LDPKTQKIQSKNLPLETKPKNQWLSVEMEHGGREVARFEKRKKWKSVVVKDGVAVSPVLGLWVGVAACGQRWVGREGRWRWRERFEEILDFG